MPNLTPAVPDPEGATFDDFAASMTRLVEHPSFPCVGAKSAFHRSQATLRLYETLASPETTSALATDLRTFVESTPEDQSFVSFLAMFRRPQIRDEKHFERLLWRQLTMLADTDTEPGSTEVSADPESTHFGFSFSGIAFFVVGLHPQASRDARRAGCPVLVFNPHRQFERLRTEQRFTRMRDVVRRRDVELQGTINPMMSDYGTESEARQYSGRDLEPDWTPPEWKGA